MSTSALEPARRTQAERTATAARRMIRAASGLIEHKRPVILDGRRMLHLISDGGNVERRPAAFRLPVFYQNARRDSNANLSTSLA